MENVVSAFDGFGREICSRRGADIRFQNLSGARRRVQQVYGFDFADGLTDEAWTSACHVFQKRHLLAHKMGVIDAEYIEKANDTGAVLGRRVRVSQGEVSLAANFIETMGRRLFKGALARCN